METPLKRIPRAQAALTLAQAAYLAKQTATPFRTGKPLIIQEAENNWPEDEALIQAESWLRLCADYPEEAADNEKRLRANCARMETFFAKESDAAELVARFRRKITELTTLTFPAAS